MKNYFLPFRPFLAVFILFLSSLCEKPLQIEKVCPNFLTGKWKANRAADPKEDTVLIFSNDGHYSYSISRQTNSTIADTSYWEKGVWHVAFLDYNHNKAYDNSSEENHLYTDAEAASISANVGRGTYSMFKYSQSGGREFLEILADEDETLTIFEKNK